MNRKAPLLLAAFFVAPAYALDYTMDGPDAGDFGAPTSDETVYVGAEATANVDRSKNAALIPSGFGAPTSNLPGSGEPHFGKDPHAGRGRPDHPHHQERHPDL